MKVSVRFFFMTKNAREKKRETRFFFFPLRVLTRLKSLLLLGFWKKIFLLFQEDERSPGGRKSRFLRALVFRVHISSRELPGKNTNNTKRETLESLQKSRRERERKRGREEERGRERERRRERAKAQNIR